MVERASEVSGDSPPPTPDLPRSIGQAALPGPCGSPALSAPRCSSLQPENALLVWGWGQPLLPPTVFPQMLWLYPSPFHSTQQPGRYKARDRLRLCLFTSHLFPSLLEETHKATVRIERGQAEQGHMLCGTFPEEQHTLKSMSLFSLYNTPHKSTKGQEDS